MAFRRLPRFPGFLVDITLVLFRSRDFSFGDRWRLTLTGEVCNVFKLANLSGRSGNLLASGFGQPTIRVTQVSGSGGPQSFQLAARVSF